MPFHTEFLAGVENFLGRYCVTVKGGMTSFGKDGVENVGKLLKRAGYRPDKSPKSVVSLTAPTLRAYFALAQVGSHKDILPFSRDAVEVTFGDDDGSGTCVPVYIVPYEGGRGLGVRLPDQATDRLPQAWVMTTLQNGCTVEISGPRSSPYASHTNVADMGAADRRQRMARRLSLLQQRFQAQLSPNPIVPGNDPRLNRTQFGYYVPTRVHQPPVNFRSYTANIVAVTGRLAASTTAVQQQFKGGRAETGRATHKRYYFQPTQASLDQINKPANTHQAIVMGHRINDQWTFYFQEWAGMNFNVREVDKFGPLIRTRDAWMLNRRGTRKDYSVDVVLSHGTLWPVINAIDETFQ